MPETGDRPAVSAMPRLALFPVKKDSVETKEAGKDGVNKSESKVEEKSENEKETTNKDDNTEKETEDDNEEDHENVNNAKEVGGDGCVDNEEQENNDYY